MDGPPGTGRNGKGIMPPGPAAAKGNVHLGRRHGAGARARGERQEGAGVAGGGMLRATDFRRGKRMGSLQPLGDQAVFASFEQEDAALRFAAAARRLDAAWVLDVVQA